MKNISRIVVAAGLMLSVLGSGSVFAAEKAAEKAPAKTAKKDEAVETCKGQGLKGKALSACIRGERKKAREAKKETKTTKSSASAPADQAK